ncbi:hypothetical protein LRP31_33540 (plasmid) [Mesorhizobium mediterraneum]|uniref:hypothetical protein n=1 Tax=Mesorhizobium mediterraneum TaxID=43617 RepID=UPI00130543EE|nr:hypothetical protein [Mesorhizobium mediterraneum]WIW57055.1 hypothetical protein LRP31_33540 [Mesorhizobium mediterraneum]
MGNNFQYFNDRVIGPRIWHKEPRFGVVKGTPVSAQYQAELVGVAKPDRVRLIGFWTSASGLEASGLVSRRSCNNVPVEQRCTMMQGCIL